MPDEDRQEELRRAHKFNRIALLGLLVIFLLGVVLGVIRKGHAFSTEQWLAEPAERVKIVDDLLERFRAGAGKNLDNDRILLSND